MKDDFFYIIAGIIIGACGFWVKDKLTILDCRIDMIENQRPSKTDVQGIECDPDTEEVCGQKKKGVKNVELFTRNEKA